jgi:hypothetical protein
METKSPPSRRPLSDSPWFWAYLFGTCALIALALAAPKFSRRQVQIEREFQGRERAAQNLNGQAPSVPMSTVGDTQVTLRPLFIGVGALTAIAWAVFWWTRYRTPVTMERGDDSAPRNTSLPGGAAR